MSMHLEFVDMRPSSTSGPMALRVAGFGLLWFVIFSVGGGLVWAFNFVFGD
jgi:hypothetical protein